MNKEEQIAQYMKSLEISYEEAEQLWEDDKEDYIGDEGEEMTEKAKKDCKNVVSNKGKKKSKPRTHKNSDEKVELFTELTEFLQNKYENVEILKETKLISVKIGEKIFKLDLIEQRPPKE